MGYIFMYLVLMVIASAVAIKINKKIDLTIFLTIASITITEYVIGLFTTLILANALVLIAFVISLVYLIYIVKQKGIKELKQLVTPGSVMMLIIYIASIVLYDQKLTTTHNEVGAWALITKNIRYYHELTKYDSNMIYSGYLPLAGIWQYFVTIFFREFKDGYLYIAHALLQYSMIIAVTSLIDYKNIVQNIITKITMISVLFTLCYLVFTSLFLEPTIGLVFILSSIYIIFAKKIDKKELGIISVMLGFMILLKDSAMLFAVIAMGTLLIKMLLTKVTDETEKTNKRNNIAFAILLIMVIIFLRYTWNIYVSYNNLNISADTNKITLENIGELFAGEAETYKYDTIKAFFKYLISKRNTTVYGLDIPYIYEVSVAIIGILTIAIIKKDKRYYALLIVVILANTLFLLGTLGTYIFIFARWEAEYLSALVRYLKILTEINVCSVVLVLFDAFSYKTIIGVCATIVIAMFGNNRGIKEITKNKDIIKERLDIRIPYFEIDKYRHVLSEKDKIYFVTEYPEETSNLNITRELDLLRFKYQIAPFKVGMIFDTHITEQDIINKIKTGYTYVYFHRMTEATQDKYQFLFDEGKATLRILYKIVEENNKIKLIKVE